MTAPSPKGAAEIATKPQNEAAASVRQLPPLERYEIHLPHDKRFIPWIVARPRPSQRDLLRLVERFRPAPVREVRP
jgi:hypothetical protein